MLHGRPVYYMNTDRLTESSTVCGESRWCNRKRGSRANGNNDLLLYSAKWAVSVDNAGNWQDWHVNELEKKQAKWIKLE